ncbi:MAG: condensation domain-containing protein, partial [Acidobacteriota bacterium]
MEVNRPQTPDYETDLLIFDEKMLAEKSYWVERLSDCIERPHLCLEPILKKPSHQYGIREWQIDAETYAKLVHLTGEQPILVYATLMAALKACLYKHTGDSLVVVGSPARRLDNTTYSSLNVLAIVNRLTDQISFQQLLIDIRLTLLDAYARQQYPYRYLIRDLGLKLTEERFPLFDVMLVLKNIHITPKQLNNDLVIEFEQTSGRLTGIIKFDKGLFTDSSIELFIDRLLRILKKGLSNTSIPIADLELLTKKEFQQLLTEWNRTVTYYPPIKTIKDLFEEQVNHTPTTTAVIFEDTQLSYQELNQRSNQLAHYLQRFGIGPETL